MHLHWPSWLSDWVKKHPPLPHQCWLCHSWPCNDLLCSHCWQCFAHTPRRCTGCALALPGLSPQQPRCGSCLQHPPLWLQAYAWVDYGYPWSQLITHWKFGQSPALAQHFARWMRQDPQVLALLAQADVLIPIPLSAPRMRERGYNQAAQLARQLAPQQCLLYTLQRCLHTTAQSTLTRSARLRNLQHAFTVPTQQYHHLQAKQVLLVDDVFTTGATLAAASHCLLQAGVAQVNVLCLARTP